MVAQPTTTALRREARQHPRADIDIPILCGKAGQYWPGLIRNIGIGGAFLQTHSDWLEPGNVIRVVLPVPGEAHPRHLQAEVVWAQQHTARPDEQRGLGVRFHDLRPDDQGAIGALVDERIAAGMEAE